MDNGDRDDYFLIKLKTDDRETVDFPNYDYFDMEMMSTIVNAPPFWLNVFIPSKAMWVRN